MAIIGPFKGLMYNFKALEDPSILVAPPYDVISEEEQEGYYQAHPHNVIRLILGKRKVGDSDWDNRYTRAADDFKRWQSEETLVRSNDPSMYMTSLTYDPGDGGGPRVRWGLIALVRIEDEGSSVILPHERTFSAHKDDRLKLMRACSAQFSQIFALYEDSENKIFKPLQEAVTGPPQVSFDFKDGTKHRMWVLQDHALFRRVADGMADKSIFIADGHHRYETARNFRNMMRARYGLRPAGRSYEYVMMYLTDMNDVGLTILPSHRLIKRCSRFDPQSFLDKASRWFEIETLPPSQVGGAASCEQLKEILAERGRLTSAFGFHYHGAPQTHLLSMKPEVRDEMGDDLQPSLKQLDVLVLSRFILQRSLGFSKEDLNDEEIFHYNSDMAKTLSLVDSGAYKMTFLLNPTKIEQVKEVASASLIMPRKSTYFFPKVITGLVFNKIDPHEIIEIP